MIKRMAGMLAAAVVTVAAVLGFATASSAQDAEFKQLKLTEQQVLGFIAAQPDLTAISDRIQKQGQTPDPKLEAELEQLAKKHGFASFTELDDVAANITMVLAGIDPQTGEFTDPVEQIKKEMDEVRKDKSISEADKKQMLAEMEEALKVTPPIQHKENIAVVKKHQKAIEKSLQ